MEVEMAVIKLKYVNEYVDRTGKVRRYFRRGAIRGVLPGSVGSAEFMASYEAFLDGRQQVEAKPRSAGGTVGRLITEYYGSRAFLDLKPSSRNIYRCVLEPFAETHGHRMVRDMPADKVAKIIEEVGKTKPAMGNLTASVLRALMKYAVKEKWRSDNPVLGIEPFKVGTHHTWTEGELRTFEQRWPLGTRERLAYALLLYTIQRTGDVSKMKRSDIEGGEIHVIQQKTGVELYLPILPELALAMKAYPANGLTLIGTGTGKPLGRSGLSNFMARAIELAGLPAKCVAHGLRKAGMRRMAEAGYSEKQIAAWSGHTTLKEIERYTKAADQRRLVRGSIMGTSREHQLTNGKRKSD
jgi:enterobacteria phage integrase